MSTHLAREFVALFGRRYPDFVYGARRRSRDLEYLPIFAFHSADPSDFEAKLEYLRANGYRTVNMDQVVTWMRGDVALPGNSVAITIDDGRLSTWTVAYPLLKKYGMTATAFVIAGYAPDGDEPRPTLEDVWSGRASLDAVRATEDEDRCRLASWREIQHMHESGVVQIESHTTLHRRVFTSEEIVGFITPSLIKHLYDTPLPPGATEPWTAERIISHLGAPLFRHSPVLSVEHQRVVPDDYAAKAIDLVRNNGGAEFFSQRGWRRRLMDAVQSNGAMRGRNAATAEVQRWELTTSKQTLEERLRKRVRHLCFPHGEGGKQSMKLCAEAGYESSIWNVLDARSTNRRGCSVWRIGRLKHDFIYCLPGDSRRSLTRVIGEKFTRRLQGETGY